ncbi:MAG TPA: potassium transporter TrkG [Gammaproteobacteria bacterium]|nr:potassium transporter TrkG [Gammaproteobacteria bacterium]
MIKLRHLAFILGPILMFYSATFCLPAGVALIYGEPIYLAFLFSAFVTFMLGFSLHYFGVSPGFFRTQMSYFIVVFVWVLVGLLSMIPFIILGIGSWVDCFFEAFSGLTTTGAEVFSDLDTWPYALRWYHQQLEFVGGLGIITVAVVLIAFTGLESQSLYQIETKETKLMPRVGSTVRVMFMIYFTLFLFCLLGYYFAGMTMFESMCEAMTTVSTGGFSIYSDNMAHYQDLFWVGPMACVVMVLSALSYRLHYYAIIGRSCRVYIQDEENKKYLWFTLSVVVGLVMFAPHDITWKVIQQFISMITTTGYSFDTYLAWPNMLLFIFVLVSLVGGCSGSTSGGIRVLRLLSCLRDGLRCLKQMIHPKAIQNVSINQKSVSEAALVMFRGFLVFYLISWVALLSVLLLLGLDWQTALASLAACLSNTGAALGSLSNGYGLLSPCVKSALVVAMVVGRVEIMAVYVILLPSYWRS